MVGNVRVTEVGKDYDTHHVMLDFGKLPFPVLEGQSIGILPPGLDEQGRVHHVGSFPELEDQMCSWTPGEKSPDRMDAAVWALTDLMVHADDPWAGLAYHGGVA